MIVCDVCNTAGNRSGAVRYVFPVRRIDVHGPHEVNDVYSVDLCEAHAREFWDRFCDLMRSYSSAKDDPTRAVPAPKPGPPDWRPEVGKTYSHQAGSVWAKVTNVTSAQLNSNGVKYWIQYTDEKRNIRQSGDAEFIAAYGTNPVVTKGKGK